MAKTFYSIKLTNVVRLPSSPQLNYITLAAILGIRSPPRYIGFAMEDWTFELPAPEPPAGWRERETSSPPPSSVLSESAKNNIRMQAAEFAKKFAKELEKDEDGNPSPERIERIAKIRRDNRKSNADFFRRAYTYDSKDSKEKKTCIWSDDSHSWLDKFYGITWVGVHGIDSICVVTRVEDLDMTRVSGSADDWRKHEILYHFRKSAIYEIEDLTDPSSKLHKEYNKSIEKPFSVVCVIQESGDEGYDEKKAIDFLKETVQSNAIFCIHKTIRAAISALQHLCKKEFKANEIEVSVMDPNYRISVFGNDKDLTIEELPIPRIKKYLVAINEPHFKDKEPDMEEVEKWCIEKEMAAIGISTRKKKKFNP